MDQELSDGFGGERPRELNWSLLALVAFNTTRVCVYMCVSDLPMSPNID